MEYKDEIRLQRKLKKISKDLNKLLVEVKEHYPDANYMVDGGVISIIPTSYEGDEKYSETGSIMHSDFIENLDCGMWN